MKKIVINLSNRWLYTFIAIGILILLGVVVYATVDKTAAWHDSSQVEVTIGTVTKSLQEAIDAKDFGITSETDPTVLASVKDGISWSEISSIPSGFADGVDDTGGSPSCTLTNCYDYYVGGTGGSTQWAECPSSRPVMKGLNQKSYDNTPIKYIRCCAITCS